MRMSTSEAAIKVQQPGQRASSLQHWIEATLVVCGIALITALTIWMQGPPNGSAARNRTEFSVDLASEHVKAISQIPHPIGSVEHANVQKYICEQVKRVGLVAEILPGVVVKDWGNSSATGAVIENISARLKGTEANKSILLTAHYDTVPTSGGTADDSAGVAAILEIMRAIQEGPRLKHDIVALFTDGEEVGGLGSWDFVRQQSRVKDVGLVINLEARGNRGSSLMFETSSNNGWLIGEIAKSSARPVTSSLMYEIYRIMPYGTDLTNFKNVNLPGLNFAFIDGPTAYHTATDNIIRLDRKSLQDQGDSVLALVQHFGNLDTIDIRTSNQIFFNGPGRLFFHYPEEWSFPLMIAVMLWLILLLFKAVSTGEATWMSISGGLLQLLASAVLAYCIVWAVAYQVQSGGLQRQFATGYLAGRYNASFVACTLAVYCTLYIWFRRIVSVWSMLLSSLIMWGILAAGTTWWIRGASYLFVWPLICILFSITVATIGKWTSRSWLRRVVFVLPLIIVLFLVVPMINLILIGLGLKLSKTVMLLVVLLAALIVPQLELCDIRSIRQMAFVAVAIGIAMMLWGVAGTRDSVLQPGIDNLLYLQDAGKNRATWASVDAKPDSWTAQYLTTNPQTSNLKDYLPESNRKYLQNSAPVVPLVPPKVDLIGDSSAQDSRTVQLRFHSIRRAPVLSVYLDTGASRIIAVEAAGTSFPILGNAPNRPEQMVRTLVFYNPPVDGVYVTIKSDPSGIIRGTIVDRSYGLPRMFEGAMKERPNTIIPMPWELSDTTQVVSGFAF